MANFDHASTDNVEVYWHKFTVHVMSGSRQWELKGVSFGLPV